MDIKNKLKLYNKITNYAKIARRYFINNFYDGNLTVLGVLLGFFVALIKDPSELILSSYVILTGIGTSISMLISGASGSYLSEKAEQRKAQHELHQAMGVIEEEVRRGEPDRVVRKEVERAMLRPIRQKVDARIAKIKKREEKDHDEPKTLHEKAEGFAGIIVSLVNGISPFLGGLVPIIPFFFVAQAGFPTFIIAFIIIFISIIFLGIFLGAISNESKIKNVLKMSLAFALTLVVTILFLNV